jgi:four helix bundle protein
MQDFKQLQAWQRAHALSIMLHGLARGFTRAGHASLRAQLTRAADSIAANIVEGCGSSTGPVGISVCEVRELAKVRFGDESIGEEDGEVA